MQVARFLRPECVKLTLGHGHYDQIDPDRDRGRELVRLKREAVEELVDLFMKTGQVRNRSKFSRDLWNREKQASTAVGDGVAVPHVRSMQPRKLGLIFARSREGVAYAAPDDKPVHLFFGLTAPPYDDRTYLQFYKWIAQSFLQADWLGPALLEAADEHEIIGILSSLP